MSTGAFSVNDLLGGTTQLRVWWRGTQQWRVDSIKPTGETDLHHVSGGIWTWDYESGTAQWSEDGPDGVRLPRTDDLVPGNLARRLLSESRLSSAARLPDARIAGHDAAGVRVTIADRRSTIRHIDVWALPANGLPLRVAVYGRDATPVVSTTMYDLGLARPPESTTAFVPIPGTLTRVGGPGDIVAAIDELGRNTPPASLAGLPRRTTLHLGGVGVYGRGRHGGGRRAALGPAGRHRRAPAAPGAGRGRGRRRHRRRDRRRERAVVAAGRLRRPLAARRHGHAAHAARRGRDAAARARVRLRPMIRTHGLTKRFGSVLAVDGIDLDVREGDVYGFLGANGSGKTTTVRIVLGLVLATSGTVELLGEPMPRAARRVLPEVGTLVEGPAAYGHLSARANLQLIDAAGGRPAGSPRAGDARGGRASTPRSSRWGWPASARGRSRRSRSACASGSAWPPRCCASRRCWCSTSRRTGWTPRASARCATCCSRSTRRARPSSCPATCWPRSSSCARGSGCSTAAGWSCRTRWPTCRRPPGARWSSTSDPAAAVAVLGDRVEARDGQRLVVRCSEPAELNERLVRAGVPVHELAAQRRTLEEVVLERTSAGSDRVAGLQEIASADPAAEVAR